MPHPLLVRFTGRNAINIGNVLLVLLLAHGVWEVASNFARVHELMDEMEELLEGMGTILVALGVALEERETLLKFLGVYPGHLTPLQQAVDHHCHGYGLLLLLVGLFVEVSVYVIRMPNLDTIDFDPLLIVVGAALSALGAALLARLAWILWRLREPEQAA